jgi:hypothetical protein
MLGAERLLSDRQRALCNWNGLQVLPRYVRYFARLVARRRGGTQPASGGFSWIGKAQGFRMPINPPEIVVLVHRLLLDPMIVSITICLVFVAGFIFGYGVRAHLASASSPLLVEIVSSVVGRCASNATA